MNALICNEQRKLCTIPRVPLRGLFPKAAQQLISHLDIPQVLQHLCNVQPHVELLKELVVAVRVLDVHEEPDEAWHLQSRADGAGVG